MKNHKEIFKAFIDKKTITCIGGERYKLINGNVCELKNGSWRVYEGGFVYPEIWEIEQEWYEKDISGGVLCRVKSAESNDWGVDIINYYSLAGEKIIYYGVDGCWNIAEPLDITKPLFPQLERK